MFAGGQPDDQQRCAVRAKRRDRRCMIVRVRRTHLSQEFDQARTAPAATIESPIYFRSCH